MKKVTSIGLLAVGLTALPCSALTDEQSFKQLTKSIDFGKDYCSGGAAKAIPFYSAQTLKEQPTPDNAFETDNEVYLDLKVKDVANQIYNPAEGRCDNVRLRAYVDESQASKKTASYPYIAPTIETSPGKTVRLNLDNQLPTDDSCLKHPDNVNKPHCFNGTNMHTHGLWINPAGNSDNVLIKVNPGVDFNYEYNIPADHPAGTFWYHPHLHGSTALQVTSGMAGALIIKGDRQPAINGNTVVRPGDLDLLLNDFNERTLMFQQIAYACFDNGITEGEKVKVITRDDVKPNKKNGFANLTDEQKAAWYCPTKGEIKRIKQKDGSYEYKPFIEAEMVGQTANYEAQLGPGSWPASGRYTSINGIVLPKFTGVKVGELERWRLIHAGVRDTIDLKFCRKEGLAQELKRRLEIDKESGVRDLNAIRESCVNARDVLEFDLIASDGLTMDKMQTTRKVNLQPGYRWDLLVQFPEAGEWVMIDDNGSSAASNVNGNSPSVRILGTVVVDPDSSLPPEKSDKKKQLIAAANAKDPVTGEYRIKDKQARNFVTKGLKQTPISLAAFQPHDDLNHLPSEKFGRQEVGFTIYTNPVSNKAPALFMVSNQIPYITKENATGAGSPILNPEFSPNLYSPDRIDRNLVLDSMDEWHMGSSFVGHPYHIHVNPFQITKILDPFGRDVSGTDAMFYFQGASSGKRFLTDLACIANAKDEEKKTKSKLKKQGAPQNVIDGVVPEACLFIDDADYRGLKGLWKDTIFVKQDYTVIARTHYRRYIGDFVLHCHILDHEDQGMMQNVRISVGDGLGGTAQAHGHH